MVKLETKTPAKSVRRQPVQALYQEQIIPPPPKQPNFLSTKSSVEPNKRGQRLNDNASPTSFRNHGAALRHPDTGSSTSSDRSTSTCSTNSPLKAKAAQHRSVSASATIPALSKLNLEEQTSKGPYSVLRAKTAIGNYKPVSYAIKPAVTALCTPKQQSLSLSTDKRQPLQAMSQNTLYQEIQPQPQPLAEKSTERVTPSIRNLVSHYIPSSVFNVKPVTSYEPIRIRPDSRDDVYDDRKLYSAVVDDEDDFVDDYDDEYDYAPAGSMSLPTDAPTASTEDPILAIDQLSMENRLQPSDTDDGKNTVIGVSAYPDTDTEISFISPEHVQEFGLEVTRGDANDADEHGCF
ncbi:hypothetical protein V1517DRAFT_179692 [Lipomyces orientalis]|uniref:Uncharacterized protein n=1 Tax=Lipomyces orientalis TaxID=1233043 RepID=A0ACC3TWA2_9ASCO